MNSTDPSLMQLSTDLFEDVVVPLSAALKASGSAPFFPLDVDTTVNTYFEHSQSVVVGSADFEFPGGGARKALIDALVTYWIENGDSSLAEMRIPLTRIAEALDKIPPSQNPNVDIFCYTLF